MDRSLEAKLGDFFGRKARGARKELSSTGSTSELPVGYHTIRDVILSSDDLRAFANFDQLVAVIVVQAVMQGLVTNIVNGLYQWDLPREEKEALIIDRRGGEAAATDNIPYRKPTIISVPGWMGLPHAHKRAVHPPDPDGMYDDPTTSIDDA